MPALSSAAIAAPTSGAISRSGDHGSRGAALGLIPPAAIPLVVAGATAGALLESALGATLEGPGILNNDMLNFINTAVAAAVVLVFA